MSEASIRQVTGPADSRAFLAVPARLAPLGWGVPLRWDEARFLDPSFNGFFRTHDVARFLAWRDGIAVGRIAACVPHDVAAAASFGFLCAERDAIPGLLDAARRWIAARGRADMFGPLSFTINHEVGAQVGFHDRPRMLRMPRTPPWLPEALAACGLAPVKDIVARTANLAREDHRARFAALAARRPAEMARLSLRPLDRRDYRAEVRRVAALYDDAWAGNWGAVPLGSAEVETLATLLRPLLIRGEVLFAEWDGAAVGLLALVPNIDAAFPADGRLLPFAWARLAAAIAGFIPGGADHARIPMLGIARAFRRNPASGLTMGALLSAGFDLAARRGWQRIEISWILDDNVAMQNAMARLPAPITGRWRIWRSAIGEAERNPSTMSQH